MRVVRLVALSALSVAALVACKKPPVEAPKVGWVQEEGWKAACYFPKDWSTLGSGDRKIARQETLQEMEKQWRGQRNDGVDFGSDVVDQLDTTLLGRPENIESVAAKNASLCEQAMKTGDMGAWQSWMEGLNHELTVNECNHPLLDTYFNYLTITSGWQDKVGICKGNKVAVESSEIDYYRITDKGPWINGKGDESQPTIGKEDYPCNIEGCVAGMVIMRFTGDSGIQQIFPVGLHRHFEAPENGYIEVQINDTTWYDNVYKVESGLEHHTSITYKPD